MPAPQDSGKWPPWRKQLKNINDPIADERFTYRTPEGKRVTSRVIIGRPEPVPKGQGDEWFCPLFIEGETVGIMPVLSLGPVGAVVNAGSLVRQFLENVYYPDGIGRAPRSRPKAETEVGRPRNRKAVPKKTPGRRRQR